MHILLCYTQNIVLKRLGLYCDVINGPVFQVLIHRNTEYYNIISIHNYLNSS